MMKNSNDQKRVKRLDNDYIRSNPTSQMEIEKRKKILKNRRLAVFFVIATIFIGGLGVAINKQNNRLAEMEKQKQQVEADLAELIETQENLNIQIEKLEDEEYIAKLARKEYFLSDEGEIIFTIPNENEDEKEKENK